VVPNYIKYIFLFFRLFACMAFYLTFFVDIILSMYFYIFMHMEI